MLRIQAEYELIKPLFQRPAFIAFRGAFIGAFFSELQTSYSAGHLTSFDLKSLEHMAWSALVVSAISLWHLYIPVPDIQSQAKTQNNTQ
jgi:hypothetical protein